MKLDEVIRKIIENPKKKFVSGKGQVGEMTIRNSIGETHGTIVFEYTEEGYNPVNQVSLAREWEEVKEPLTFMEVLNSGKKIGVEHKAVNNNITFQRYRELKYFLYELQHQLNNIDIADVLQNGEFYTED